MCGIWRRVPSGGDRNAKGRRCGQRRCVLTDVAKDTYTRPGYRHPLSDETVNGIRNCLALITARETELNAAAGRSMDARPRFIDEPQDSEVVSLKEAGKTAEAAAALQDLLGKKLEEAGFVMKKKKKMNAMERMKMMMEKKQGQ